MANMTPEERQQFMDRMRARGFDPEAMMAGRGAGSPAATGDAGAGKGAGASVGATANWQGASVAVADNPQRGAGRSPATGTAGGRRGQNQAPAAQPAAAPRNSSATTIDALFGPLPPTESFGQVWLFQNGKLVRLPLRVGITDGQQTELIQGDLKEGEEVVTSVITAAQRAATNAGSTAFHGFQQNRGGGGFGGGGFPGGGGPRGGGGR
jgi:HlyD family secretion protein